MNILAKIFNRVSDPSGPSDGLQQQEREAIIDLLLLCMYADNHLSLAESKVLTDKIEAFDWDSPTYIDIYISDSTAKVRRALADSKLEEDLLHSLRERIVSDHAKHKAKTSMYTLFYSDGEDEKERQFRHKVTQILN